MKQYKSLDFYPTKDKKAVKLFLDKEKFTGGIWEPCCGDGSLSSILFFETDQSIKISDIANYGLNNLSYDFLDVDVKNPIIGGVKNIVTNPPYTEGRDVLFTLKGIEYCQHYQGKLALLMRSSFRHSQGRYNKIFIDNPYSRVYNYIERISLYKDGIETKDKNGKITKGMVDYSWFVWDFTNGGVLPDTTQEFWI